MLNLKVEKGKEINNRIQLLGEQFDDKTFYTAQLYFYELFKV